MLSPALLSLLMLACLPASLTYNHIDTPYYKVILTSSYEDNLQGVHLANKLQQDHAMSVSVQCTAAK